MLDGGEDGEHDGVSSVVAPVSKVFWTQDTFTLVQNHSTEFKLCRAILRITENYKISMQRIRAQTVIVRLSWFS